MALDWTPWLGLPHEIGADPRDGKAACCLVMCLALLEDAGFTPPRASELLPYAHAQNWVALQKTFDKLTEPLEKPELYALTLIRNGPLGLGLAIVVTNNKLLFPHHRRGVVAVPIEQLRLLQFRRLLK